MIRRWWSRECLRNGFLGAEASRNYKISDPSGTAEAVPLQTSHASCKACSIQRIARQLGVARSRGRKLALVQIELVRRHCTEVRWRDGFELGADALQAGCGALAGNGTRPSAAGAGQCQMRGERAGFARESQRKGGTSQLRPTRSCKCSISLDADPENAWGFRIGEETGAAKRESEQAATLPAAMHVEFHRASSFRRGIAA